jgi:hypothetical protein
MHAVLSIVGRSLGLDHLPLPHGDRHSAPLLDVESAVEAVCCSTTVTASVKCNLLTLYCPTTHRGHFEPIAASLFQAEPQTYGGRLLDLAYETPVGADPLRRPSSLPSPQPEAFADLPLDSMTQDAQDAFIVMAPTCVATTQIIGGVPALSLSTTIMSRQPFSEARAMADPLFWPQCEPQSLFFKEMKLLGPGKVPLPGPDRGWSARILEVVDFSYGRSPAGAAEMATELDFVVFESDDAAGCTYDLHRSHGREILVDRGFVMVEDLRSIDWRRTTTLKQVYFRSRANPGDVCRFWSLAHGMVSSSCSTQRHAA